MPGRFEIHARALPQLASVIFPNAYPEVAGLQPLDRFYCGNSGCVAAKVTLIGAGANHPHARDEERFFVHGGDGGESRPSVSGEKNRDIFGGSFEKDGVLRRVHVA